MKEERFITKDFTAFKRKAALYYNLSNIRQRLDFLKSFRSEKMKFLFPVKSFPHPRILKLAGEALDGFDVSNSEELELALPFLEESGILWSSSPFATEALKHDKIRFFDINQDHDLNELCAQSSIRICTSFMKAPSRFGVKSEKALALIERNTKLNSIHVHLSGQHNTVEHYMRIVDFFQRIASAVEKSDPTRTLHFNFGGGFAPLNEAEVGRILKYSSQTLPNHILYFEPGRWVAVSGGFAAGKVLAVREEHLMTSLSPSCHLKWIDPKFKVRIFQKRNPKRKESQTGKVQKLTLCGPTCYEGDLLGQMQVDKSSISKDDLVIIDNISGYAHAWNHSFNGVPKADIVFFE